MSMNPRLLRPTASGFNPRQISGLALWLDAADSSTLYTTDAGAVAAVSSPLDISGCALWLDASDASTISDTAGAVDQWDDKSGNALHFAGTTTSRPTTGTRTQNGRNVLDFDGNDFLLGNAASLNVLRNVSGGTAFVVGKIDATSGSQVFFAASRNGSNSQARLIIDADPAASSWRAGGRRLDADSFGQASSAGSWDTNVNVLTGLLDYGNGDAFLYENGTLLNSNTSFQTDGNTSDTDSDVVHIGATGGGLVSFLDGIIAEIIVYPTALSTADRARVEAYLAAKWGIANVHAPATAASQPVGYWGDKSGNGRHATQSTAASRPTVSATTQNNRRTLSFSQSASQYYSLGNLSAAFPSQGEVFVAYGVPFTDLGYSLYVTRLNSSYYQYITEGFGYPGTFTSTRLNNVQHGSAVIGQHVISQRVVGGQYSHRKDGADVYSAATTFNSGNDHYVGGYPGGDGIVFLNGNVHEVLAYSTALSASERQRIERYLAAKWGISLAPQVGNADAQDWINRVYANGGTVSTSTAAAVNTFCDAIDAAGIRDRFYRLNLFSGTGLGACLTPVFRGPVYGGTAHGNATDTNINFVSSDYSESGSAPGLLSNGTKHLDTGLLPSVMGSSGEDQHLSTWVTVANTVAGYSHAIGAATSGSSPALGLLHRLNLEAAPDNGATFATFNTATASAYSGVNNPTGHLLGSAVSDTDGRVFINGVQSGSTKATMTASSRQSTHSLFVFGNNSNGSASTRCVARMSMYSAGLGMSPTQAASFYAALSAFNSAMGRTA